jgi:hypothetical protein
VEPDDSNSLTLPAVALGELLPHSNVRHAIVSIHHQINLKSGKVLNNFLPLKQTNGPNEQTTFEKFSLQEV